MKKRFILALALIISASGCVRKEAGGEEKVCCCYGATEVSVICYELDSVEACRRERTELRADYHSCTVGGIAKGRKCFGGTPCQGLPASNRY
jgi:hypothetical protein